MYEKQVYEGNISSETNSECKRYLAASETSFEEKFRSHTRDFKHKNMRSALNCQSVFGLQNLVA